MHSSQWVGGDAPVHFDRAVNEIAKSDRQLATGAKPVVVQSAVMKQPNIQQLRALRLSALARDNKVVNAIRSSITQAPDALVKELMDVHGWPAHEALCAVQQLQQDVLDDTTEQISA